MHGFWHVEIRSIFCRFCSFDLKQWRQSYKALVLLEFLLAHGPDNLAKEYRGDTGMIQELSTFTYKDENGYIPYFPIQSMLEIIIKFGDLFSVTSLTMLLIKGLIGDL